MTLKDMAEKLGYTYATKKSLVSTDNGHYTRTDHLLTDKDGKVEVFRDRTAVTLFLESKAQLELVPSSPRAAAGRSK